MSVTALPELTPENFINRELSTIAFQERVLAQAEDDTLPLLERLKFVAIVGNNMDEFFMVRVAGYIQKMGLGIGKPRPDGLSATQVLEQIRERALALISRQRHIQKMLLDLLEAEGVAIVKIGALGEDEREALRAYFEDEVFPVITPLAVDRARPFPLISNRSLNLGVYLMHEEDEGDDADLEFARIKIPVPDVLPRLVNLRTVMRKYAGQTLSDFRFVWIEDLLMEHLPRLFPGMRVVEVYPFRVLRDADIDYEHEQDDELLDVKALIEQSVRERRFGTVVRLSVPANISERMLALLIRGLEADPHRDIYMINGALGSADLFELMQVDRPDLKDPPHVPRIPEVLPQGRNIFAAIRQQDIMLHHPYDSFGPVEEFFREAAQDPDVLAIKATLYRVGKNSPVVDALMAARDNDKQVAVLVELKARFDEENNLGWVQALEDKGVHVIYGVEELPVKTHAKIAMVVRREPGGVRRYVHLGTGNYNASTARLYTDLAVFTCNEEIADDTTRLFNRLTGYAPSTHYDRLLVAPEYLYQALCELIDNEIAAAQAGLPARIIMKMNQLEEDTLIQRLYAAAQAGVRIDLIVRGVCCLRPGMPGLSENIHVMSIIGRFLEHSRIFYFQNAPEERQIYLGSADIMRRNLFNRVEVVFPVLDPRLRHRALRILATQLHDNAGTWVMLPDGTYDRLWPGPDEPLIHSQSIFIQRSFGLNAVP